MLFVVIVAFVLGVITSVPIGALGQLMINRLMREGFWAGLAIGLFIYQFVEELLSYLGVFFLPNFTSGLD